MPEAGLYFRDTRYLTGIQWWMNDELPVVLSSAMYDMNRAQIDLTNPEMVLNGARIAPHTLHFRLTFIMADRLYARMRWTNFARQALEVTLRLRFSADFRDIFEIRGVIERTRRGMSTPPQFQGDRLCFSYLGLDGVKRDTEVALEPGPEAWELGPDGAVDAMWTLRLEPRVKALLFWAAGPSTQVAAPLSRRFTLVALKQARAARDWIHQCTYFETDNRVYNAMLQQATVDMRALMTDHPQGRIVDAGIPWYVAPFGRDAAITAIETLLLNPTIARESLQFLAALQGREWNDWRDEEPGKILHELRQGELAGAGEIPHTPYYGSIDSTLWWLIGVYETWRFTNDLGFLESLAEAVTRAVDWILQYGDRDGDGFVEYLRRSRVGLENQGWKDSFDSVLDENGRPVPGPIALVEVQGYAYYALHHAAEIFRALGKMTAAETASIAAHRLRERFLEAFFEPDHKTVFYALDGLKRPVRAGTSNEGHLLFSGLLPQARAREVIRRLMHPDMLSGFGVRTLSQNAPFYNPMSYHNGSVWPHDNAVIAWGLKVQGALAELMTLSQQLYDAAQHFPLGRLPELYCGFTRRAGAGPVEYPVACNPQAWAAAVPFFLLRLWLGISVHGHEVRIEAPELPPWINELYIDRLAIAGGQLTLEFARGRGVTYANVVRREGALKVVILPRMQ
jgi:glycogen debranching enzyme